MSRAGWTPQVAERRLGLAPGSVLALVAAEGPPDVEVLKRLTVQWPELSGELVAALFAGAKPEPAEETAASSGPGETGSAAHVARETVLALIESCQRSLSEIDPKVRDLGGRPA